MDYKEFSETYLTDFKESLRPGVYRIVSRDWADHFEGQSRPENETRLLDEYFRAQLKTLKKYCDELHIEEISSLTGLGACSHVF